MYLYCSNVTGRLVVNIDGAVGDLITTLDLGEQVCELVNGELIELGRVLDDIKNLLLSSLVEVRLDVTI